MPKRRRGIKLKPTGLLPADLALADLPAEVARLARAVADDGGAVLSSYREPLGGHTLLLVALPIERVAPTPFQRDVADGHVRRLVRAMDKTKRFLDPVIVVREERAAGEGEKALYRYWVPNGYHRLTALKELGAKTVLGLLVPETAVAYQILALNIEKAHNLRERAIGVLRMVRDLASFADGEEEDYALEFEEPALITLGFAYVKRPRFSGGAYHPILRKTDAWLPGRLRAAIAEREVRADALLALDDAVVAVVAGLKERGFASPYVKTFVVARVNPLPFIKGALPALPDLLATMSKRARGLKLDKIRPEDVARSGGGPPEEG
ncbi:MAG: ParB N-terminal domain-containing protein [Deltaproteobacteria bacterium]|jgi:ParB family chromosome partitioning protein|nr:ParB N-terminal domain-containing protein [Deltaproteobacteria bacterium]